MKYFITKTVELKHLKTFFFFFFFFFFFGCECYFRDDIQHKSKILPNAKEGHILRI